MIFQTFRRGCTPCLGGKKHNFVRMPKVLKSLLTSLFHWLFCCNSMLSQLCQLSSSSNLHRINEPAKTKIMPKPWCHTPKHLKELADMRFGKPFLYIAAQLPHIARDAYSTDENNLRMHFAWDKFGQFSDTYKLTLENST